MGIFVGLVESNLLQEVNVKLLTKQLFGSRGGDHFGSEEVLVPFQLCRACEKIITTLLECGFAFQVFEQVVLTEL